LIVRDNALCDPETSEPVAPIIDGIPRFVDPAENYAESFGWQWKNWADTRSMSRGATDSLRDLILARTHFEEFDLTGKTILECGMGGGDDTEALLTLPFSEVHAFDLSTAVERGHRHLQCDRLFVSQASIFDIPYPDESFDVVYCHRVLQHTPDPEAALACICRKVKPGGIIFAHAYKRSVAHMIEWRYKYRWLTKRLPRRWIHRYVEACGTWMHHLNRVLYAWLPTRFLAYTCVPFYFCYGTVENGSALGSKERIELEKLITFDALTPMHDHPMRASVFTRILREHGFELVHFHNPIRSPMYCTAVRTGA